MNYSITAFGLSPDPSGGAPRPAEVEVCRRFILAFGTPTKTIRRIHSSYGLKHIVENWSEGEGGEPYVTNGAFIRAAADLDIPFIPCFPGSLNAFFALSWKLPTLHRQATRSVPAGRGAP